MEDPTTIALNLTFFGTLGLAFLMFLGLFLLVVATLVLAGIGRLVALAAMALFGRLPRHESLPLVRLTGQPASVPPAPPAGTVPVRADDGAAAPPPGQAPPSGLKARLRYALKDHPLLTAAHREPPVLAQDWAAAVAQADARAMARARAAVPEVRISVRDLPDPGVPAEQVAAVAPLVESALHQEHPVRDVPRSFKKPSAPAPMSPLDTGSLASLSGHAKVLKGKLPVDRR